MKRIYLVMAAILVSLFAFSCGGGSGQVADPNTPAGGNGDQNGELSLSPFTVEGERGVSIIDGKLNIRSAVSDSELDAVLGRYNCAVDSRDGSKAVIDVPPGTDLEALSRELVKEYAISDASPIHRINIPVVLDKFDGGKVSSWVPQDPYASTEFVGIGDNGTDLVAALFPGQGMPNEILGMNSAWDVTLIGAASAAPVNIAIIDAGFYDYSVEARADLDATPGTGQIDEVNSGSVASDGTFVAGYTAASWDLFDDGDPGTQDLPFRQTGENLFGMLASLHNNIFSVSFGDTSVGGAPPDGTIDSNEIFNEGIAGMVPNAKYMLIKTGEPNGNAWSFTDNHIAESIDHAVAAGANIILLGMFAEGPVGGSVSTALANAADNDVLCIAPAGDTVLSYNAGTFDAPADIGTTSFTPASDPNCFSVSSTGFKRVDISLLDPQDPGAGPIPNNGRAFRPFSIAGFNESYFAVQACSNTNTDISAPGFGIGWAVHPYSGGTFPGHNYNLQFSQFGTAPAAAYVAGAAAMVYKSLSAANGTPPSDDEVRQVLLDNVHDPALFDFTGVSGGLLNISQAVNAVAGGGVSGPAMGLSVPAGQLVPATLLTTFQLAPAVTGGTGPFDLSIDWGNGDAPTVVNNWASNDPVALTGGWDTLGLKTVLITVSETTGDMRSANRTVEIPVYNAITSNLTVMGPIDPQDPGQGEKLFTPAQPIQDAVTYTFSANVANVFNGSVNGTPNNPQFGWDFDGDNVIDKPGTTVEHAFINTGSFNIKFIVTQDVLPDFEVTRTVLVN
ncbi:MAG: hypothetical protein H7A35_02830 [Planctomycetales bacterium]|nr:hypothetical protein [bacterium]UNM08993.1 MAG: hypothetical protein H7A35_02830 [Planctomycetales bacterium]